METALGTLYVGNLCSKLMTVEGVHDIHHFKPAILRKGDALGLALLFVSEQPPLWWGMTHSIDVVALWRAIQIIEEDRFEVLNEAALKDAYALGLRHPHPFEVASSINPFEAKQGKACRERMLTRYIPEEIIELALALGHDPVSIGLHTLTNEVAAGTIKWSDELAQAGVKNPADIAAERKRAQAIVAEYEPLLASFARFNGSSRGAVVMGAVEDQLVLVITQDLLPTYSKRMQVALATVFARLALIEAFSFAKTVGTPSVLQETVRISAGWYCHDQGDADFLFWASQWIPFLRGYSSNPDHLSQREVEETLTAIFHRLMEGRPKGRLAALVE